MRGGEPFPPASREPRALQAWRWLRRPAAYLSACERELGGVFAIAFFPGDPFVIVSDPAAVEQVLEAGPGEVAVGEANKGELELVLGARAVVFLDGEEAIRHRRIIGPLLHGAPLRAYLRAMTETTERAVARWRPGTQIVFQDEMARIAREVVLRTVWGIEEPDAIEELLQLVADFGRGPATFAFKAAAALVSPRGWEAFRAAATGEVRWLPRAATRAVPFGRYLRARAEICRRIEGAIAARRRDGGAGGSDTIALITRAGLGGGGALSDEELRDEILTLFVAGSTPAATSTTWALSAILRDSAVRARVRAEIEAASVDGSVPSEKVYELRYLGAAIRESMRLYPVQPLTCARMIKRPLRVGGFVLPPGCVVVCSAFLTQRRPDVFREPTRFLPERFLERDAGRSAYYPFGGGGRRCPGAAFALQQLQVTLAIVLARVELEPIGPEEDIAWSGAEFGPANGGRFVVTRRLVP